jgi:hypothetical protein
MIHTTLHARAADRLQTVDEAFNSVILDQADVMFLDTDSDVGYDFLLLVEVIKQKLQKAPARELESSNNGLLDR